MTFIKDTQCRCLFYRPPVSITYPSVGVCQNHSLLVVFYTHVSSCNRFNFIYITDVNTWMDLANFSANPFPCKGFPEQILKKRHMCFSKI